VLDRPGVLGHITGILGEHEIGIASMTQKGAGGSADSVPVLMRTHLARESALREALDEIEQLSDLTAPTRLIRIEEGM
jgi:homoserine dehydrogenase